MGRLGSESQVAAKSIFFFYKQRPSGSKKTGGDFFFNTTIRLSGLITQGSTVVQWRCPPPLWRYQPTP